VNLGETPSSEFVQWVLWVIRLTKTVKSICCAVNHTVTMPRAVWRTIRSPHSVRLLIAMTTNAGRHRPSDARPTMMPAVYSINVEYYAELQRVCCSLLAAIRQLHLFGDILGFILCYSLLQTLYWAIINMLRLLLKLYSKLSADNFQLSHQANSWTDHKGNVTRNSCLFSLRTNFCVS